MQFTRARAVLIPAALLALSLGTARADFPARVPRATLVQVLSHGKQALLLDRASGEYSVVKVGDSLQGFRVSDIESDQIVLASGDKPQRFFVLPLVRPGDAIPRTAAASGASASGAGAGSVVDPYGPSASIPSVSASGAGAGSVVDPYGPSASIPSASASGAGAGSVVDPYGPSASIPSVSASGAGAGSVVDPYGPSASPGPSAPSKSSGTVVDPYGSSATPSSHHPGAVIDPYGPAAPVRSVEAPPASRATSSPDAHAPAAAAAAATPAPAADHAAAPAPVADHAVAPAQPGEQHRRLSRRELDHALADFAALAKEVQIERAPGGGVLIRQIGRGSFFARLGLEPGDIVRTVAGHTIDTADDAADAYAAVVSAHDVLVEIDRHGTRVRLHLDLVELISANRGGSVKDAAHLWAHVGLEETPLPPEVHNYQAARVGWIW